MNCDWRPCSKFSSSESSRLHAPRVTRHANLSHFIPAEPETENASKIPLASAIRKSAWGCDAAHQKVVQPFRICRRKRGPPACVPPLDLTQFNGPDEFMDPIKLTDFPPPSSLHSQISWGCRLKSKYDRYDISSSLVLSSNENVVTNKRSVGSTVKQHYNKVSESSCTRKLNFEACIVSLNGRDVHRELGGFYYLADGSISIYEFRQFGKRSSALPLIQRGVYYYCAGSKKGKPYEIRHIKKGNVLQFTCKNLPELPVSVTIGGLLSIKITAVDEELKWQLLCDGCNLVQCRQVEAYLSSSLSPTSSENKRLLQTLQGMFCNRLRNRATKTLVSLGRHLLELATDGVVSFIQLQSSLRKFYISLTIEDMQQFWKLLCRSEMWCEDPEGVLLHFCLHMLTGGLTADEASLVCRAFMRLDSMKSGYIEMDQMKRFFISDCDSFWMDIFDAFQLHNKISFFDFENFHLGAKVENSDFCNLMRTCWGV